MILFATRLGGMMTLAIITLGLLTMDAQAQCGSTPSLRTGGVILTGYQGGADLFSCTPSRTSFNPSLTQRSYAGPQSSVVLAYYYPGTSMNSYNGYFSGGTGTGSAQVQTYQPTAPADEAKTSTQTSKTTGNADKTRTQTSLTTGNADKTRTQTSLTTGNADKTRTQTSLTTGNAGKTRTQTSLTTGNAGKTRTQTSARDTATFRTRLPAASDVNMVRTRATTGLETSALRTRPTLGFNINTLRTQATPSAARPLTTSGQNTALRNIRPSQTRTPRVPSERRLVSQPTAVRPSSGLRTLATARSVAAPRFRLRPSIRTLAGARMAGGAGSPLPMMGMGGFSPALQSGYNPLWSGLGAGCNPLSSALTSGYNPYLSNPYGPYGAGSEDPYGGYLRGTADVISATGQYLVNDQQANLLRTSVRTQKVDTQRRVFDQWLYERQNTPTTQDDRERSQQLELRRSRNDPPMTEIVSAKALNDLLAHLQKTQARDRTGTPVSLEADLLAHINITSGKRGGHIGVLKDGGRLDWPVALQEDDFQTDREQLTSLTADAVSQVTSQPVQEGVLTEMLAAVTRLNKRLAEKARDLPPGQYIEAKRFLHNCDDALKVLQQPDAADYFNRKYAPQGKTVLELVQHMTRQGLQFAPAVSGDEAAYLALHRALVAYDVSLQTSMVAQR